MGFAREIRITLSGPAGRSRVCSLRKPPPIVVQPSWSETGGVVLLHARHRTLGEPFVLGAFLSILGIDLLSWGAVQILRPTQGVACTRNLKFCYADPVPDVVTY